MTAQELFSLVVRELENGTLESRIDRLSLLRSMLRSHEDGLRHDLQIERLKAAGFS
jgi:hypothetical protein